jgi:SAM-dependent methyltransferase
MDAVRRGDMAIAQRMVDAAAKAAGYTVGVAEHRSKSPTLEGNAFDLSRSGERGGVHAKFNKPAIWFAIPSEKTKKMMESLKSKGFPSPYGENVFRMHLKFDESSDFKQTDSSGTEIIAITDPSRIKSADPVTYDDAGNVIPLSQRFDASTKDIRNPRHLSKGDNKGININDKVQDYTGQILRGEKTIETRPSRSLDSRIGKRTGIIRTGAGKATLVGYAIIGEPVVYDSVAKFRRDQSKHRVAPGSVHDIKGGLKYGYPLMQVEAVTPRVITSRGNVIRKLNPLTYPPEQITYAALSPTAANTDIAAGKTLWVTPAFKKWFGDSKVRDLAKRPMVVYHGTCSSGFTKFDPTKTREMGFHFGTSSQAKDFLKGCGTYRGKEPGIYPVYLSIQNPLFTPDVYSEEPTYFIEWLEKTNHIHNWFPDEDDSYYRSLNKLRDELAEAKSIYGPVENEMKKKAQKTIWGLLRKVVMRKGYDGVRYKNENEGNTDDPYNIAWIAFSPAQVKSATDNRGTFNRRDPDLRNPMKSNPMDPRSAMTQIAGTKQTYAKAAKMLGGKVLDYGAGLGIGTDILRAEGLLADSFEPYPKKWKGKRPPTYTDSAKIPSSSYDSLVSFSVINVVEPDMRKFLFQEVARILRSGGVALITGRDRSDVEKSTIKIPHLEEGGYLIDEGEAQRYQKGFTQTELERYAKEVLGTGFTVERNKMLNGASIKITKGKTNPVTRSMIRTKLSRIIEPGDRILDYDRAQGEDLYRLWDMVHTDMALTPEALVEIEGMLDDDGVLVIQSGEEPAGLRNHFRRVTRYNGMLLVQGPLNPEEARINTEKLRRDLE